MNASVLTRAKLGKSINGHMPYGYKWMDRKLVIISEEAAIRRQAYELFLQHRRKGVVAKLLNAAGYRTRNGNIWRDTVTQTSFSIPCRAMRTPLRAMRSGRACRS